MLQVKAAANAQKWGGCRGPGPGSPRARARGLASRAHPRPTYLQPGRLSSPLQVLTCEGGLTMGPRH